MNLVCKNQKTEATMKKRNEVLEKPMDYWCSATTDAFIEKAWDWIEDNILSPNQQDKSLLYYEQFKNYIKRQ